MGRGRKGCCVPESTHKKKKPEAPPKRGAKGKKQSGSEPKGGKEGPPVRSRKLSHQLAIPIDKPPRRKKASTLVITGGRRRRVEKKRRTAREKKKKTIADGKKKIKKRKRGKKYRSLCKKNGTSSARKTENCSPSSHHRVECHFLLVKGGAVGLK